MKKIGLLIFAFAMPALAADRMMEPPGGSVEEIQARMFAGVSDTYSGAEIKGRIVDAENGEPIEGAVVVASWQISKTHFHLSPIWASREDRLLHVTEALSDREGRYVIPAWGPTERPAGWSKEGPSDPRLAIFKPGYEPTYLINLADDAENRPYQPYNSRTASVLRSMHDGTDIALCKYGKCTEKGKLPRYVDPMETRTPEQISKDKIWLFASHLERNVELADPTDAKPHSRGKDGSPLRLDVIRRQRQAILTVHEELQKLGKTAGRAPCYPGCHSWSSDIREFVESEHGKK